MKLVKPHALYMQGAIPVLFIVRVQTLIEHMGSTTTDACVPWDVWGKTAAVLEVQTHGTANGGPYPVVQGVHVILVKMHATSGADGPYLNPHFHTFDLSLRGCSLLPFGGEGGGTERTVSFEGGQVFLLPGAEWMFERGFNPLSDGRFVHLVSLFRRWKRGGRLTPCQGRFF